MSRYSGSELTALAELLGRLPVTGADCKVGVRHAVQLSRELAERPLRRQ